MQIIENWAEVHGDLVGWVPGLDPGAPGVARVRVQRVRPVGAFPNLFSDAEGREIEIRCPSPHARSGSVPAPGSVVTWRIRKAGPNQAFLHPDELPRTDSAS